MPRNLAEMKSTFFLPKQLFSFIKAIIDLVQIWHKLVWTTYYFEWISRNLQEHKVTVVISSLSADMNSSTGYVEEKFENHCSRGGHTWRDARDDDDDDVCDFIFSLIFLYSYKESHDASVWRQSSSSPPHRTVANGNSGWFPAGMAIGGSTIATGTVHEQTATTLWEPLRTQTHE